MTKEEKAQKKLLKKYTIFRFGKIVSLILLVLFIAGALGFGMGIKDLNDGASEPFNADTYRQQIIDKQTADPGYVMTPDEREFMLYGTEPPTNPMDAGTTVIFIIGTVGFLVLPFVIFRKFLLALTLMGVAMWDVGFIFPGMFTGGENVIAIAIVAYAVIAILVFEKIRSIRKQNYNLTFDKELVENLVVSSDSDRVLDALNQASLLETNYKGNLYFTLSAMLVAMTGIGLLLPFGKWSYKYNKNLYFQTSDWKPLLDTDDTLNKKYKKKKYNPQKPYKYILDGLIYINEKPFYTEEEGMNEYMFKTSWGMLLSAGYVLITGIFYEIKIRANKSFLSKDDGNLGDIIFSAKDMAKIDAECAEVFVAYAKKQSAETRDEIIEGLHNWYEDSMRRSREELARMEEKEAEKIRQKQAHAKDAHVYTDDNGGLYAEGYDAAGNKKQYKLEEYDENSGVGTYTDESGKKVNIKNNN